MMCFSPARFVGSLSYTNQFCRKRTERYNMKITPVFDNGVPFLDTDSIWKNFSLIMFVLEFEAITIYI